MISTVRPHLVAGVLFVALTGAAQAYTINLRDDYNGGEYGSIWATCNDGTEFEVRFETNNTTLSYSIGVQTGTDEYDLIAAYCASRGG